MINDQKFKTRLTKDDGTITFIVKSKEEVLALYEYFKTKKEFKFSGSTPNVRQVSMAIFKSAYLLAFKIFGYGFILHKEFELIREQLRNPDKEILPSLGVLFGNDRSGIFVIKKPDYAQSFFINFELKIESGSFFAGALIPCPSENVKEFYTRIKPLIDGRGELTVCNIHCVNYLTDKNALFYSYNLKPYFSKV